MRPIRNLLSLLFGIVSFLGFSQEKVQVVTKTVQQSVVSANLPLQLQVMKASVRILPSNSNEIDITWKFTAKNSDKVIAEKEIGFIATSLTKLANEILLKNTFAVPKSYGKLTSQLTVEAIIKVPNKTSLRVNATYSTIQLENCSNTLIAQLKFGKISLINTDNTSTIQANLADIFIQNHAGNATIISEKGSIHLADIKGKYKIESKFGDVKISTLNEVKGIELVAYRSTIACNTANRIANFRWDVLTKYAAIELPPEWKKHVVRYLENQLFEWNEQSSKPIIKMNNQYETIQIR